MNNNTTANATAAISTATTGASKKSPNLYHMLTEGGLPASPLLRPTTIPNVSNNQGDGECYAWMQASRTKRRRHNSPLMNSLTADPALMASAGIVPQGSGSSGSSGRSSYLASPSTGLAMMSLGGSPPMTPKMMIQPLTNHNNNQSNNAFVGSGRRNPSPLILPLDTTPEERMDRSWWQEMLRARQLFLEQDAHDLDWENITVVELKRLLRKYGLNSTGKKTLLIGRVQEAIRRLQEMDLECQGKIEFKIDELVAAAEEKSREESSRSNVPINEAQPNNAP